MSAMPSLSRQPLLAKCLGSAVLPTVEHLSEEGAVGSAKHEHLMRRATHGMQAALDSLDEIGRRWGLAERETAFMAAEMRKFRWQPPRHALTEVALCLTSDGNVVRVEGGRGHYPELPENAVFAGQIDLMWSEPEPLDCSDPNRPICPPGSVLYVPDYKTGDEANVTPVDRNEQALGAALLGARWTRAERVVPAIIFPRPGDGEWDLGQQLGPGALDRIADRFSKRHLRVLDQRERYARGEPLELVAGPHCTWCPSASRCPAQTAQLKTILGHDAAFGDAPLTDEELAWWAARLGMIRNLGERVRETLESAVRARRAPIDLGDENVWGPEKKNYEEIDIAAAMPIVLDELGQEYVNEALHLSKDALGNAIARKHSDEGIRRQRTPVMRRLLARMHEAGAIRQRETVWWTKHRAKVAASIPEEEATPPPKERAAPTKPMARARPSAPVNAGDDEDLASFI